MSMVENNQPRWKEVEYSRSQIIKAGKIIRNSDSSTEQITEATQIIDNWRAAHSYPLHVIYIHLRRLAGGNSNIIVAERLKRLDSIVNKLKREPNMSYGRQKMTSILLLLTAKTKWEFISWI